MNELERLRQRLAQVEDEIAEVLSQIESVPDNWPTSLFVKRLNDLEARGLILEEERQSLRRRLKFVEEREGAQPG